MIQNAFQQLQQETTKQAQTFIILNSRIRNILSRYEGSAVRLAPNSSQYHFVVDKETLSRSGKFNFYLKCDLRSALLANSLQLSLKQFWEQVVHFGRKKILTLINHYNLTQQFTYEFNEPLKLLIVKIFDRSLCALTQYENKLNHAIQTTFELINPILNPSKYKRKQTKKKLEYIADMIEVLRRRQDKATKISNIKKLVLGKIKQVPLTYESSENIQKFQNSIQKYKEELFQRFLREPNILRCIKQIEESKDSTWANEERGAHAIVYKTLLKYQISEESSIHSQTNEELDKAKSMSAQQKKPEKNQKEPELIPRISWLVKKMPSENGQKSFEIEKQALIFLRAQKCSSINSYYTKSISLAKQIDYLYSDFHENKLFQHEHLNVGRYFSLFQTVCQGLVFLRENSISHRDLKPENILVSKNIKAKIIDFGSACHNRLYVKDQTRQKQQKKLINDSCNFRLIIVETNQQYNLTYFAVDPSVRAHFTYSEYNTHPFFDVYAFGSILDAFMDDELQRFELGLCVWKPLQYLSNLCRQQNPDDRPDPLCIYVFLKELSKIIQLECQ